MVPSQRSLSSMQTLVQLLKLSWEQFRTQNRLDVPFSAVLLITNILMLQWYKEIWKCTFIVGNFSNCVIVVLVECMDGWQYPWLLEHIFGQIDSRYVKLKQEKIHAVKFKCNSIHQDCTHVSHDYHVSHAYDHCPDPDEEDFQLRHFCRFEGKRDLRIK